MTSTNPLKTIIQEAILSNFGKNFVRTFIIGIQASKAQVICILDCQTYTFPFNHTIKEFKNMGEELELTEINDAWLMHLLEEKSKSFLLNSLLITLPQYN